METTIQGNPTKKFFIDMITRDISIEDAIIDLLDNSIDGANKQNPDNYTGLWIKLDLKKGSFSIKDNCGGFSLETAEKYAFRFGRPEEAPKESNTVGRFGIGMKRSLFKIGKNFSVESQCKSDHFKVVVDVEEWSTRTKEITFANGVTGKIDDWDFSYEKIDDTLHEDGTNITINNLASEVVDLFSNDEFIQNLSETISKVLNFSFLKGLKIFLNDKEIKAKNIELFVSDNCNPFYTDGVYNGVKYKVIAGLGVIGNPKESGWYIYCNNRLVVEADQSNITGWGVNSVPKWHIEDAMFRGVVFFDSEETLKLPLTTTKKGIDATSMVYTSILPLMKDGMTKVRAYLKAITGMKDEANDYRKALCETQPSLSVVNLKAKDFSTKNFIHPELDLDLIADKKSTVRISYEYDKKMVNKAKEYSDSKTYKELGITTFEYYLTTEDINNE